MLHITNESNGNGWLFPETTETITRKRVAWLYAKVQLLGAWKIIDGGSNAFGNLNFDSPYIGLSFNAAIGRVHF